jgi:hypothetical protein
LNVFAEGFFFATGDRTIILFPSTQPGKDDSLNEFRINIDHLAFTAQNESAVNSIVRKIISAAVDTKGMETYQFGKKYVAFRIPNNIQL